LTVKHARRSRRALWALLTLIGLVAVACAKNAPQDALSPDGPVARQADNLFRPVFWIAVAIFVLVEGMLVYALIRFRRRSDRDAPKQIHGNQRLEIMWTILPAALLAGIAVPTVLAIFDVAARPVGAGVVNVKVIGHQWWWEYEYTDIKTPEGGPLKTANELVIPTDRWVYLEMTSADVIHSYWVPRLAGKQDVIPNRITTLKLRADQPGMYEGQCAEFCALSHANMRLRVIAQDVVSFDRWVAEQTRPAPGFATGQVGAGFGLAASPLTGGQTCMTCHTIRGHPGSTGATTGPDLTHFASRTSFAGSMLQLLPAEVGRANLVRWLDDPPEVKPGSLMPDYNLTGDQIESLVAYLLSLE
jgi:cytochrome c oxidase subunit 2